MVAASSTMRHGSCAGDWPRARRGHVAAILGDSLVIHGGFDGERHMGDTWRLDLGAWCWERLELQVRGGAGGEGGGGAICGTKCAACGAALVSVLVGDGFKWKVAGGRAGAGGAVPVAQPVEQR